MLVIVILGILASLIIGNFVTSLKKGRDARRKEDLVQIQRALEMYYEDQRLYPTAAPNPNPLPFGSTLTDPASGKVYMEKLPSDPSGGTTTYGYASDGTYYHLYACLENDQQILPYQSSSSTLTCNIKCSYSGNSVPCVFGISDSNSLP